MTRTRSRGAGQHTAPVTIQSGFVDTLDPSRDPSMGKSTTRSLTRLSGETFVDELTPGFFGKLKSGVPLPVNPCSHTTHSYTEGGGFQQRLRRSYTASNGTTRYQAFRAIGVGAVARPLGGAPQGPEIPSVRSPAGLLIEATANARQEAWDAGTSMAEASKTISLVKDFQRKNLSRMRDLWWDLKNNPKNRKRSWTSASLANEVNSLWLSGRYGWRPLVYEYQSVNNAVKQLVSGSTLIARKLSKDVGEVNVTSVMNPTLGDSGFSELAYSVNTNTRITNKAFVGVELRPWNAAYVDPFVTTWELVPYSFVLDWFVNIGDAIAALSPVRSGRVVYSGCSSETVCTRTFTPTTRSPSKWNMENSTSGSSSSSTYESYTRWPLDASFSLEFRVKLDALKVADIAALIYSYKFNEQKDIRRLLRKR